VTLRARLTAAFLAVVLGPVLLGAIFVGTTVTAVNRSRALERLDLAATAVRTSIGALCEQLRIVAENVALAAPLDSQVTVARRAVSAGHASAVHVADAAGLPVFTTPEAPPSPWADCAGQVTAWAGPSRYAALSVRVEVEDEAGLAVGAVTVARTLDDAFVRRLADASGAGVTLLGGADGREPADLALSTLDSDATAAVVTAAGPLVGQQVGQTKDARYVRRDGPVPGQPLPLVLSLPHPAPGPLYLLLLAIVGLAALAAVAGAWWLARSTTKPLADLAHAVDLVAGGDLATRVPVRNRDEVGRLAEAFNRMTRETQAYVQALTASRDQLRGHVAVLGDTLSGTHDLDRILRVLLRTALAATGARAGAVLLEDPAGGAYVGHCIEGLTRWRDEPGALRVAVGAGLLGQVAAAGEARRGVVSPEDLSPDEPRGSTYVIVPFSGGLLALYDRLGQDEFDDSDLVTLRTFASQAAVAVDNVRVHEEAQRLSLTDPLTGLWNYRYLRESVRREVERAHRFGRTLSVLALDLDRFKEVNDSYGHGAGDAVLAEFARRIRAEIREVDLAFRQGGEEFVALLPETDADGAVVLAQRLGAVVRATPITVSPDLVVPVTVSIGIAVFPDHGGAGPQVLQAADDALYAAKAAGRDTYRVALTPSPVAVGRGGGESLTLHAPRQSRGG